MNEGGTFTAPYTCPICLRVTQHNDRHRLDIGLRTYLMCKSCFDTLDRIRTDHEGQHIASDTI